MANKEAINEWLREHNLPDLDQLEKMPEAHVRRPGYAARGTSEGVAKLVPQDDMEGNKTFSVPRPAHMDPMADPVPRATQERIASLTARLVAQYESKGFINLNDSTIQEIQVEALKTGKYLSGEDIRRIAMHFLEKGEVENEQRGRTLKLEEVTRKLKEGGDTT